MHIITRKRLNDFADEHADAREPLAAWFRVVRARRYGGPSEVKRDFASASFLGSYRTVFDIGGTKYRLVVDMRYDLGRAYVRHVLTHEQYDRHTRAGTL